MRLTAPLWLWAGLVLLAMGGCAGLDGGRPASSERARDLIERGEYGLAAAEYERLAARVAARVAADAGDEAAEQQFQRHVLDSATAWIAAARALDAERLLALVSPPRYGVRLSASHLRERELLRARAAALAGDAARAWSVFSALEAPAEGTARSEHLRLRQSFAAAANQPLEAIQSARLREADLPNEQKALLRLELLTQLRTAVERGARLDPRVAARDTLARGWLEAAPLAARAAQLPATANAGVIADWRRRYPNHPATAALAATHRGSIVREPATAAAVATAAKPAIKSGAHVAALLPLSGRNAAAGRQLRDGMLAAYYATAAAERLPLRFYDTGAAAITEVLQSAARAGALFVIGPLAREEVIAAAEDTQALPTLTLNVLPDGLAPPRPDFYQFALSPEEEARAVARRALAQGQRRAIVLVPAGDWGDRVLGAFESTLQEGGGSILARARLVGEDNSPAIEQALRLDQSRARHRRLQSTLDTPLAFQPRRRGDVDLLFVPGNATALQQLRPQLRFHGAAEIPTYTTSDAWDGRGSGELAGLLFPDTRWMLNTAESTTLALRETAKASFGDEHDRHRLFAFGHDAWLLQQRLRTLRQMPPLGGALIVEGATGRLELDTTGRIQRSLEWGEIIDGGLRSAPSREP